MSGALAVLTNPINNGTITIKLVSTGSINTATAGEPLDLSQPVGDASRLFVATHNGQIRLIKNGALISTAFADIKAALTAGGITLQGGAGSDERGLVGLAFHPDFNVNGAAGFGKFYTFTSESVVGTADFTHPELGGTGGTIAYQNAVREWSTTPTSDTLTSTSSRLLFRIDKNQGNHNGGGLAFGPNKYLYIGVGDGGGANDFNSGKDNVTDGHTNTTGNGQDVTKIYGKVLRIDPLAPTSTPASTDPASANNKYRIPSNPFSGATTGADEVFLYGMRNPFRFSFDRGNSNELYVGDVGQGAREEVDLAHVSSITGSNNNYSWPYREGTLHNTQYAAQPDIGVDPVGEYTHGDGISIQGGFVYRGSLIPQLSGKYVFGDYGTTSSTSRLFYMDAAGGTISALQISGTGVTLTSRLYSIGQDQSGELYAMLANGNVVQLIPEPASICLIALAPLVFQRRRTCSR